jgi:predicted phage terminase large subunit-like protein
MDKDYADQFFVTDVQRVRDTPEVVERLVKTVAQSDGHNVEIALPIDPGQAGLSQIVSYTKLLSGYPIISERQTGSKVTRALAAAAQANIGKISLLKAPWNAALQEELASFPSGLHDDQVDALSLAFNLMTPSKLAEWMRL